MIKTLLLTTILNCFIQITEPGSLEELTHTLHPGETAWVIGKLSDSYDSQILAEVTGAACGKTIEEYRKLFWELDLELEHLETKREMAIFQGMDELKTWIYNQVKNERLAEAYFLAMQQKGWIEPGDGTICFPTKQLIACLKLKNQQYE